MSEKSLNKEEKLINNSKETQSNEKSDYYDNIYSNSSQNNTNNIDNNDTATQTDNQTIQTNDNNTNYINEQIPNDNTNNNTNSRNNKIHKIMGIIFLYAIIIIDLGLQFSVYDFNLFYVIDDIITFFLATFFLLLIKKKIILKTNIVPFVSMLILLTSFGIRFFGNGFYRLNSNFSSNLYKTIFIGFSVIKVMTEIYSACTWCGK